MNIYDFDGTIYDGDSSVDFFKFCLKRYPRCAAMLPGFAVSVMGYAAKRQTKEQMKSTFFRFVAALKDLDREVELFWEHHEGKIKPFYLQQKRSDDIIISASPVFLLAPICRKLGVTLIATDVDETTGVLRGKNCHGEEKVYRLRQVTEAPCEEFYSDSQSDAPLAKLAKQAYLVKGDSITPWEVR